MTNKTLEERITKLENNMRKQIEYIGGASPAIVGLYVKEAEEALEIINEQKHIIIGLKFTLKSKNEIISNLINRE